MVANNKSIFISHTHTTIAALISFSEGDPEKKSEKFVKRKLEDGRHRTVMVYNDVVFESVKRES